jgi:hypothetical protein
MNKRGWSICRLAEQTKAVDPAGYGVSKSVIGHAVSPGRSGRDSFRTRSCELIALALGKPAGDLFSDTPEAT